MAGRRPPDRTLLLTREWIARRVAPVQYVPAVRAAFVQADAGQLALAAIAHVPAQEGAFHIKSAVRTASPCRAVVKVNGNFPGNEARHGLPAIQGVLALLDATNGRILALMDSGEVTGRRTAAASLLAATLFARADSRCLALIGCGVQARCHFEVFVEQYALASVELFDSRRESASCLARLAAARGITARVHDRPSAAVRAADIVVTTTPSRTPVLRSGDVSAGAFIAAVGADSPGKQELEPAVLLAARVVPDSLSQAVCMGELQHVVGAGLMPPQDIHGELSAAAAGRVRPRENESDIFVFDSTGTAITDLAAAELVFEAAAKSDAPCVRFGS